MANSLVGGRLGKYEIRSMIGRGGMGTVYLGYDPLLDRQVAIKVLAPHLVWEEGFVERFLREARAAARLKHPNIVTIHDVGQQGDSFYFVMEYLEGQPLSELIRQQGPFRAEGALSLLRPLAQALDYAHERGLVHRDIKPGNVIVGPRGGVTLTDFGIAKAAQETALTTTGAIVGTPEYMSPEQARGEAVDARTDIYSLGIVAYEMLSGRTPFGGTTPHAVLHQQIYEPPPPIRRVRSDLPAGVDAVLERALTKEPNQRYATVSLFVEALAAALGGEVTAMPVTEAPTLKAATAAKRRPSPRARPAGSAQPGVPVTPKPVRTAKPTAAGRRLPGWIWALGALVALLLIAGMVTILLWGGGKGSAPTPSPQLAMQPTATLVQTPEPAQVEPPPAPEIEQGEFTCTDPRGCLSIEPNAPIRIAAMFALSGPNASIGAASLRGVEHAVDERREILGHPIELMGEDSRCTAEGGHRAAERLAAAAEELAAIVGPTCSNAALEAIPTLCEVGLPMVSPSSTAAELTGPERPDHYRCFLRTSWSDHAQGIVAAHFARDLGMVRAATILGGSQYAIEAQEAFAIEFSGLGGVITVQVPLDPAGAELEAVLGRVASTEPELIYFPVFPELGGAITRQARERPELQQVKLMGAESLFTPEYLAMSGDAAVGVFLSAPDMSTFDDRYGEVAALYREQGELPMAQVHAQAHDAAMMILAAIERAAVREPSGTLHIGRLALLEQLYSTRGLEGMTGVLSCSEHGDCSEPILAIYEIVRADPDSWNPGPGPEHNPRRIWP